MDTNKLIEKLEGYLDLSAKKRRKKHEKFLKIVNKLKQKKTSIEAELAEQGKIDETSTRYHELSQELKIVSRLIRKAVNRDHAE